MSAPTLTKKTRRKELFNLPAEYRGMIYQPNRITNAIYDFTIIQERVFLFIVFYLQTYIKKRMDGVEYRQLDLFGSERNMDYIDICIPLNLIGKPNQYNEIRMRTVEMAQTIMRIQDKDKEGVSRVYVQPLLAHVALPMENDKSRTSVLPVRISKQVALLMLNIERNNNSPINYTSFLFEVALLAGNKYTSRIYKLLSSWKKRGLWKVKYADLRDLLQLEGKYRDYECFKRRVLVPVMEELKELADFTFDCNTPEFEEREGRKVVTLNFRHVMADDADPALTECKLWNKITMMVTKYWNMDDEGLRQMSLMRKKHNLKDIEEKINYCFAYRYREDVQNNPQKTIKDLKVFLLKSLHRDFPIN